VIASDVGEAGNQDLLRKVMADVEQSGLKLSEEEILLKLAECETAAKEQLLSPS